MTTNSIKQVAEELGVSKQSVMKYIDKLGLRESLTVSGNAYFLSDKDKAAIKAEFERKTANQTTTKSTTKSTTNRQPNDNQPPTELSNIVDLLQKNLEILQQQLAEKDSQIQALTAELEQAQKLADQAQQLHAADKQKLISEQQAEPEPTQERKPTLWERLTGKRGKQ